VRQLIRREVGRKLGRVDDIVTLKFQYSERDYIRAVRTHYSDKLRLWVDIPVLFMLAVLGLYLWRSPALHLTVDFHPATGSPLATYRSWAWPTLAKKPLSTSSLIFFS